MIVTMFYLSVRPALKPRFSPLTGPVDVLLTTTEGPGKWSTTDLDCSPVDVPTCNVIADVPRESTPGQLGPPCCCCCCSWWWWWWYWTAALDGREATVRWPDVVTDDGAQWRGDVDDVKTTRNRSTIAPWVNARKWKRTWIRHAPETAQQWGTLQQLANCF